jgi:pimeloyl-ACP methyl ester carboxylesterase
MLRFEILATLLVMSGVAAARADDFVSSGVKIHYIVKGEGSPVMLLHGLTAEIDFQWGEPGIIKALAQNYRVIVMDCRGHGKS